MTKPIELDKLAYSRKSLSVATDISEDVIIRHIIAGYLRETKPSSKGVIRVEEARRWLKWLEDEGPQSLTA